MAGDSDLWSAIDKPIKKNRRRRRDEARHYLTRAMRRNLHGFGRWRRGTTVSTGRYEFPFATRLDD